MAIDYGAGSERRGAYQNLARALQMKLEADKNPQYMGSGQTPNETRDQNLPYAPDLEALQVDNLTPSPKPDTFTELEMAPIKNKRYTASSPAEDEAIRNRNALKYADDITSAYDPNYVSQNYDPDELNRIRKRALMQGY